MAQQELLKAAEIVRRGGVIAYRTDTFYGLGADPLNAAGVARILKLKGREDGKPILLLISDFDLIPRYLSKNNEHFAAGSERFWPGPLTLIGTARKELPHAVTAGTGTVGIRLPNDDGVRSLVRACGGALTATSANPSGAAPARNAAEVARYFPTGIDLIVDGGAVTATLPSTVLDLSGAAPRLVREGAISRVELESVIGRIVSR